ncbi:MAG: hypothetical protein A2W04_09125 [Betaproteobacteria bacterium RBG_16_64_9]|nr:MAG: hypothetical protein A2W04_09125 [Betaproteobacteria bacterium RBG_16_64_9]OGA24606.1 MAG: hypothetical protein A3I01_06245 [Betaproteobacteria bacterium RIFCSPLOWO2_02_FULL_65_24]OGA72774.1 MAG: hypothetical protein A3G27_11640 [Betaproteobacteria bacterium RIFCSPLOWO2_12_FULL_66_14]
MSVPKFAGIFLFAIAAQALAQGGPLPGTRTAASPHSFDATVERLEKSIEANRMGLVAQASASRGAAARKVKIPGNAVLMVFRNDYAVRMLASSVPAGMEAPIRIYATEAADGQTTVTWRTPSALFAPYRSPAVDALARELDPIFEKIVADALAR